MGFAEDNLAVLPEEAVNVILRGLPSEELPSAGGVCQTWRKLANEARFEAFLKKWGLEKLHNTPRDLSFLENAGLEHFVWRHPLGRGDTVQSLAIRYGCSVMAIKFLNNITSDVSVRARDYLYIPVKAEGDVMGEEATFQVCHIAKRELVVLGDAGALPVPEPAAPKSVHELARTFQAAMFETGEVVDSAAAMFYVQESEGDLREAATLLRTDRQWEAANPGLINHCRPKRGLLPFLLSPCMLACDAA